MPRPRRPRILRFNPHVYYFKPRGIPLRVLDEVVLKPDELEALKLHEVDSLSQKEAAQKMAISQPTFARTIAAAYQKVSQAIVHGQAIRIEKRP